LTLPQGLHGGARSRALACAVVVAAVVVVGTALAAPAATPRPPAGAALAALSAAPTRPPLASQRIYFVMTDRYANGDPSNDAGGRTGGRTATGLDPTDVGWFHGGDLAGLRGSCTGDATGLARIKALGFTSIWITPPFGQKAVQGDSAGYHGYWITDFTAPDPHLGTAAEFGAMVDCAHALGLKVILDVVVNHTADVVSLTGGSAGYVGPEQVPYRDCRGRPFRPVDYVGKPFPCMSARFMPRVPVLIGADRTAKKPAWLNDPTRYHDRGDIDFGSCNTTCLEQGDFYGLDDLFTERRDVVQGLAEVYGDWIERYKIDGIRIDTARHVNAGFFHRWLPAITAAARRAGVKDFSAFGEVFDSDTLALYPFVRYRGLPTLLDFPLQGQLVGYASGQRGSKGIASVLADDDYFQGANGLAYIPPTFLGNHDMGRVGMLLRQGSGDDATLLRRDLLAHDLLYLLRGAPVVYYGDEVGMMGSGGDKLARQDMFPTRVAEWRTEPRVGAPPIGTGSSFDVRDHPLEMRLEELARLRDEHPALSTGPSVVRLASGPLLAVSRFDLASRHEYLAAFNAGTTAASLTVPTATPGSAWSTLLGPERPVQSASTGRLTFSLGPLEAVLLRADAALPARPPVRPSLTVRADQLTNLVQARATVASAEPVSVAFAVKRARGGWGRIAADGSPPYRGFLDPQRFRRGERAHVVALARWPDGTTTVSRVVATTPRPR
jgi:glycosidase